MPKASDCDRPRRLDSCPLIVPYDDKLTISQISIYCNHTALTSDFDNPLFANPAAKENFSMKRSNGIYLEM